ncbi:MAG: hypothetical protein IJ506_03790 [Clostridia bacterium]|nr:hypothetical protein [Clostridia bacterium]
MQNYFDDKNREFVIADMYPRRPWLNYLWNDQTVSSVNQFGFGNSFSMLSNRRRNIENGERHVYIKDRKSGEYYSANRNFDKLPFDKHECHVGLGYQKIISEYNGIRTEFIITLPKGGCALQFDIKVENISEEEKEIDVYFYNQPLPSLSYEAYGVADYDEELQGILYSHIGYRVTMPYTHLYLASEKQIHSYDACYNRFCGVYTTLAKPNGLTTDTLANLGLSNDKYVGVFQYRLSLKKSEIFETVIACGVARNREECIELAKQYANKNSFEQSLQDQKDMNEAYTDTFTMQSDDDIMDSQVNVWLKRQISLGKTWGRIYGKGFRDTLQDLTAFVSFDPKFARERLLYILKHMFEDGNTIRMFEPNFRYPYNDGATWIPAAILAYLNESGDVGVLDEKIPYIKGNTKENTSYVEGVVTYEDYSKICTEETYSVFDHLQRAMDYLYGCRGKRGLILLHGGDWNDSLNAVGKLGKGEGVWLTIATVKAYNEFIQILKIAKKEERISEFVSRREELKACIMKHGFESDRFIYCYNDYDEKIGSEDSPEAKIFLNPQTWSVLGNVAEKEILESVMDSVESNLACDFGYIQCNPPFTKGSDRIGRVSYFFGGNVENGSVYNHGVAFKAVADCLLGRGDAAYKTLKLIRYDNPKNLNSGVEPYAVTNMYTGPYNRYLKGYAPDSWITGTAGWTYRCITEYFCGVQAAFEGLKIAPCLPTTWNKLNVTRKFRGATYRIAFERGDCNKILVNGKEIVGNVVPLQAEGTECDVRVYFR